MDGRRVFYVYDSYHIASNDWARVLNDDTDNFVRDGFFIALWLNRDGGELVRVCGFAGVL